MNLPFPFYREVLINETGSHSKNYNKLKKKKERFVKERLEVILASLKLRNYHLKSSGF